MEFVQDLDLAEAFDIGAMGVMLVHEDSLTIPNFHETALFITKFKREMFSPKNV